jgi:hypothetical protein
MTWIINALEQQRRDAEKALAVMDGALSLKEKLNQQMPSAWEQIADVIKRDVEQLNAAGRNLQFDCGVTMIQVRAGNEIAAIFTLEIDPTNGTLHYNCPVPPGNPGVPAIGTFQMRVGSSEAQVLGRQYGNGRGPVVEFKPEQISQFLFSLTLFPKNPPQFHETQTHQ